MRGMTDSIPSNASRSAPSIFIFRKLTELIPSFSQRSSRVVASTEIPVDPPFWLTAFSCQFDSDSDIVTVPARSVSVTCKAVTFESWLKVAETLQDREGERMGLDCDHASTRTDGGHRRMLLHQFHKIVGDYPKESSWLDPTSRPLLTSSLL
jgi:hypothetical protein